MLPRVAIVYLSYNSRSYIEEVFDSIKKLHYPKEKLEVIVVDNNSPDGSAELFRDMSGITFFPSAENLGFAEGNNLGVNHALLNDVDYVYLLNNDAMLHQDAIMEAVKMAESDEQIGSVQSRMMLWKHKEIVNSTGGMVHFLGFGFVRDNGRPWSEVDVQDGEEITYASGAAVLYRASVLRKVGLLDPFLFLYHEDLELGWRIRLAGLKNVLSTTSIAYHDYEFKRSIQKFYWMERNRFLVHFSHLRWRTLILLFPFMVLLELGLIVLSIKGGWLKEKVLVYIALLRPKAWIYIAKKRRESRIIRSVPDQEIIHLFTGRIAHQEISSVLVEKIGNPVLAGVWWCLKRLIRW
jgi:GT2 family glycosyltransferase